MEPTVCQAPIRDERQYRATSGEIQGTIVQSENLVFWRLMVPDTVAFRCVRQIQHLHSFTPILC